MTREEAVKVLETHKRVRELLGDLSICNALDMAIFALREQPVVHGRWVLNKVYGDHECSVCGQGDIIAQYFKRLRMNYCPNCGARMDSE